MTSSTCSADPSKVYRNIMADRPRVTRFQIDWAPQQQLQQMQMQQMQQMQMQQMQQMQAEPMKPMMPYGSGGGPAQQDAPFGSFFSAPAGY